MDNNKGATNLFIHLEKGKRIFDKTKDDFVVAEVDLRIFVKDGVGSMKSRVRINADRSSFMTDVAVLQENELFEKWFLVTCKHKLKHIVRGSL